MSRTRNDMTDPDDDQTGDLSDGCGEGVEDELEQ